MRKHRRLDDGAAKKLAIIYNEKRGSKYVISELKAEFGLTKPQVTAYVKSGILIKDFHGPKGCVYTVRETVIHFSRFQTADRFLYPDEIKPENFKITRKMQEAIDFLKEYGFRVSREF